MIPRPEDAKSPQNHTKKRHARSIPFSLFQKGAGVGLEIRHHEIRYVRVEGRSEKWAVAQSDREPVRDAEFGSPEWFQETRSALSTLLLRIGRISEKIVVGCGGPSIMIRRLDVSGTAESDLSATIFSATEHWSPFSATERETRWFPIHPTESNRSVIVQIGTRDFLGKMNHLFKELGLHPKMVEHVGMGLGNVATFFRADPERGFAVVEVDQHSTLVTTLDRYGIWLSREIGFGIQQLLRALQSLISIGERRFALTREDAERYLQHYGLVPELPVDPERPDYFNRAPELLRGPLEKIQMEIRRTLDYHREHIHGNPVERVFLQGPIRGLPGSHIVIPAGLPASLEGPTIQTTTGARLDPQFAAATGLAASALQNIPWKVAREAGERKLTVSTRPIPLALAIGAIVFIIMIGATSWWANREQERWRRAEGEYQKSTVAASARKKTLDQIQEISNWKSWTSQSQSTMGLWGNAIQIVLAKLSPDIRLLHVEGRIIEGGDRVIELDGEISERTGNLELRVLSFIERIQKEKGVQSAAVTRTSLKPESEIPTLTFHGSIRIRKQTEGTTS